ncbi:MAG: VWA domain-containing protein [Acidobacteriota bacterium]|nr:VWA domain-containing protein [Acidobacteriota bacterium]
MKSQKFTRCLVAGVVASLVLMLFVVSSVITPVAAQSGRRPQPTTTGPKYETQDKNGNSDSSGKSNKPLVDSTPVDASGTIKMDTTLVTIPASVIDRSGKFVPFMTKRDFHIFEDGVEQEIEHVESVESPFNVVLLIDTSGSTAFRYEDMQAAAMEFVEQLRRDDKVMIATFDSEVNVWCDFTNSREELRRAIYKTKRGGNTKLYDAVDLVMSDALSKVQGRKAVVLFSDGVDTSSRYSSYNRSLNLVEESGALAYSVYYDTEADNSRGGGIYGPGGGRGPAGQPPIGWPQPRRRWPLSPFIAPIFDLIGQWPQQGRWPRPGGGGQGDPARGRQYMQDLADRSGGRFYTADSLTNISRAFAQIAEELRHQYAISYYPSNDKRDGAFRQVKVRVNQAGLVVRARDGYRAGAQTQASTDDGDGRKRPQLKRRQLAGAN